MLDIGFYKPLLRKNDSKIVLLVMDGVGGLPDNSGKTTLEAAHHPYLDRLATEGVLGVSHPIAPGITPGSGPSHLSLFGYDPIKNNIGRGVLEALGVGLTMTPKDIAARANFATMDAAGKIIDRRAGRIPTERNQELCQKLKEKITAIQDVEVIIKSGKEHRFVAMFRGEELSDAINDNDPQDIGVAPLPIKAQQPQAEKSAMVINEFIQQANAVLKDEAPANTFLLRGIASRPQIPTFDEAFGLRAAAIATYPMYRGLASLVGMDLLDTGNTIADEFTTLEENWDKYDFFYLHVKKTDSYGEDGNYQAKKEEIEATDRELPRLLKLNPAVITVSCDHSTPAKMKAHSWHPSPVLLWAPQTCLSDDLLSFGERNCMKGGLGVMYHVDLMPLMLAHALRLNKYGA